MKRGAELALETIIVAIIVLVVLVVLIYIFVGKSTIFAKSTGQSCQERGGTCLLQADQNCDQWEPSRPVLVYAKGCVPKGSPVTGYDSDPSSSEVGKCCVELGK